MFNPNDLQLVVNRRFELQRYSEQRRLVRLATKFDSTLMQRLLTSIGRRMVMSGRYLLERSSARTTETAELEYLGRLAS